MKFGLEKWIFLIIVSSVIAGCEVGPDFHSPAPPLTNRYTDIPVAQQTVSAPTPGGESQIIHYGQAIPAQWWVLFHSTPLNCLIAQGIERNPNLLAAQAALRVAGQNLRAGEGALFPSINLTGSGVRQRVSGDEFGIPAAPSQTYNLYQIAFNVSYTLDAFGGIRRKIEALGAQVDFQRYEWDAAYLTLTSNIVTTAITDASLRAQIAATVDLINEQQQILQIVQQQFKLGGVSQGIVLTQATLLAQTQSSLPPLQKNLAQNRDALAVLAGDLPSRSRLPPFHLSDLNLPRNIPLGVPCALVRQRPDVQAAEALLHAASANIGVATANLWPKITLTANYGWAATLINQLFERQKSVWLYGLEFMQPLFQGGALIAQRRAAIAAFDQAFWQYQQTVLTAFQNVADSLHALEIDAVALRDTAQAENAARANFVLTRKQYQLGGVSFLTLLTAEQQYQQTRLSRVKAEAQRYLDTAALFQSLGGGWQQER